MSYEEEFDRLMREKAGEMQYPFEETHWQKASELISKSRGGRYKTILWSGVALIGVSISALFITSSPQSSVTQLASAAPAVKNSQSQVAAPVQHQQTTITSAQEAPAAESQNGASEKISAEVAPTANKVEATPAVAAAEIPEPSVSSAGTNNALTSSANELPAETQKSAAPENNFKSSDDPAIVPAMATAVVASTPEEEQASEPAGPTVAIDESSVEQLQGRSLFLATESSDPQANPGAVTEIKLKDDDYFKVKAKPRVFYADVIGGAAYNYGWEKNGKQDAQGLNWYAGFNAGYFVSRNLSIGTGFQMFNIAHIAEPFHGVKGTDYDFSSTSSKTVITCEQLQYFAVPLRITWYNANKHELSIGLLGAQLWRADNTVESTVTRDNTVIDSDQSSNHELYEGMTQQLLMLNAGYAFKMSRRIYVGAEVVYGLTDLYNGTSYYAKGREVPVTIRLGLTYRLLQR